MPIRIELPKELLKPAIEGAISLRARNAKAATNPIIKEALQKEEDLLRNSLNTLTEIK